jgi:hypothetical protein
MIRVRDYVEHAHFIGDTLAKLLEWLCSGEIDPQYDQAMYTDLLTKNTAVWIFEHPKYMQWRNESTPLLWIYGQSKLLTPIRNTDNSWCR